MNRSIVSAMQMENITGSVERSGTDFGKIGHRFCKCDIMVYLKALFSLGFPASFHAYKTNLIRPTYDISLDYQESF